MKTTCPFCGRDPFHCEHNGLGMEAVAVTCCDLGDLYFRGVRGPITDDVVINADDFLALGQRIMGMMNENDAYRAKYGEIFEDEPCDDQGAREEPGNVWKGAETPFADNH